MIDDQPLRDLSERQHALVTIEQMRDAGLDEKQRSALIDGRRWERLSRRVARLVGSPRTDAQTAMFGVLDAGPGGVLRGTSAASWWGIPGNTLLPLSVAHLRGRSNHPSPTGRVHSPCLLPEDHVVTLQDIPVVVPARALFDVAGAMRRGAEREWWVERLARMTDQAWSLRLVSGATLHSMFDDLAQRGRPGIRVMRQVLENRGLDYVPPASGLESRVEQILTRAGERPLGRQVNTGDEAGWIGRVDFRDPEDPFILEVQSERFHTSLTDRQSDVVRLARLRAAGFVVAEVTDVQVWHRSFEVVQAVRDGRRQARQLRRRAA